MTDWQVFLATLRVGLRFAVGFAALALVVALANWVRQRKGH